jgi:D-arabinose 1-dehydrogenase-like Zn-dependent alcohol dehydrogenase
MGIPYPDCVTLDRQRWISRHHITVVGRRERTAEQPSDRRRIQEPFMFAVYAKEGNLENPLAALVVGEMPEPVLQEGWVRVRVTHASLNRHDVFTLLGITAQEQPIPFPMIVGNDGAGVLDDGTPVVIYPVMGSEVWHGDETLDPGLHIFSELVPGTMADYVAVGRVLKPV